MRAGGQRLLDEVLATVSTLPIRDEATLRAAYPGRSTDAIAEALIRSAAHTTASVGAVVGVWAVLPVVPAFAVEVAAETVTVVGIEVKLVAELHELYGQGVSGSSATRAGAYLVAWGDQRSAVLVPGGVVLAVGSPLRKRLSRRLARRAGRSSLALGPLLTGAAAAAWFNRRETRRVGTTVAADLRKQPAALARLAEEKAAGELDSQRLAGQPERGSKGIMAKHKIAGRRRGGS
jgi:hypothetical protein